ncbi:hypothetical protein ACWGNF_21065 [Streptomyces sp. NPDC055808]
MTVAVKGRIHVVRYDTTSVFRHGPVLLGSASPGSALIHTLTDTEHKRLLLYGSSGDADARAWENALGQAVTRARVPGALVALHRGERVSFGEVWLTIEQVGCAALRVSWERIQQVGLDGEFLTVTVDGRQHRLGPAVSRIPNVFVLWALVDYCRSRDAP